MKESGSTKHTGSRPELDGTNENDRADRAQRVQLLKDIIGDLHDGGDVDAARRKFAETLGDVEASEIAAMEEELIKGGLPVSEVQRLCDVHVGAFRDARVAGGALNESGFAVFRHGGFHGRLRFDWRGWTLGTLLGWRFCRLLRRNGPLRRPPSVNERSSPCSIGHCPCRLGSTNSAVIV